MIIDFHTHVLPPSIKQDRSHAVETDAAFAAIFDSPRADIATADDLVNSMDEEGVAASVIVNYSWTTSELCRETNDYILESCARFPGRLFGFCAAPDCTSESSLYELERCVRAGIRGIGELRPDMYPDDFSDKHAMQPLADILNNNELLLLLHTSEPVGHRYPGKGAATPEFIMPFLEHFPELTVICAHWGGGLPFYTLLPEVRDVLRNVYFDSAASPFLYRPDIYGEVMRLAGPDRVLFGTDYPLLPQGRLLKEIDGLGLNEGDREALLAGNARRLLGL